MEELFLTILNMSITASWIVLAVLAVRFLFPKAPKWIHCLLWGFVALRLLVPNFWESAFSLIPSAQVIPTDIATSQTPAIYSGIPAVNNAVNPQFTLRFEAEEQGLERLLFGASHIWLGGVASLLLYSIVTSLQLRWRIRVSMPAQDGVFLCDNIGSPFVFGILRPRIYLPSGIPQDQTRYVLSHEFAHIRRRDHWWKPLGFLLLTVYWFNPLLWLAYIFLCRDIEQACDEKVIAGMDDQDKKGYSQALLACSVHRRLITACPIAFGEISVKTRIKGVLNYKRPAFWTILVSVVLCAVVVVCFLTNPIGCRHDYTGQITIAPTCTEKGMRTNTCSLCEHSYTQSVARLKHSYGDGEVTEPSTCVHTGTETFRCTGCGLQKSDWVKKTDHIAGAPVACTEPNCIQQGQRTATCTYCQQVFVTEILPVNNDHDLVEQVLREPTCTEPGEGIKTCSRCDYQESCTYERRGHRYYATKRDEPTCTRTGYIYYNCRDCGNMTFTELDRVPHQWVASMYWGEPCKECTMCGRIAPENYSFMDDNKFTGGTPTSPTVNIDDPFA